MCLYIKWDTSSKKKIPSLEKNKECSCKYNFGMHFVVKEQGDKQYALLKKKKIYPAV